MQTFWSFTCRSLDHELLTAKLNAYGFSLPALRLFMTTYQTENKPQRLIILIVLDQKYYLAFHKG